MPNLIAQLQAILTVQNNLVSPPPYITNYDFGNPTQQATTSFFDPFFQATTGGSVVSLPAAKVFCVAVQNQSPTAVLTVTYTPFGGSATSISVGPNGILLLCDPAETGIGISALTLTGIAGTVPAMVFASA